MNCTSCGAPLDAGAAVCRYCGTPVQSNAVPQQMQGMPGQQGMPVQQGMPGQQGYVQQGYVQAPPQVIFVQPQQPQYPNGINPAWPVKSKVVAGVLAILFGGIGVHKFYLGNSSAGILYLLFCWTFIPAVVGFIEGIVYLCSNDENFQKTYHVKLK